jgi:hypothetical protein
MPILTQTTAIYVCIKSIITLVSKKNVIFSTKGGENRRKTVIVTLTSVGVVSPGKATGPEIESRRGVAQ